MSFEIATRNKFRFQTSVGNLSTEDLWDLPLVDSVRTRPSLNQVAQVIHKEMQQTAEVSFVNLKPTTADTELSVKMEIVKHIIAVRIKEQEEHSNAAAKKQKKQHLLALMADKEAEKLGALSVEELAEMVKDLD